MADRGTGENHAIGRGTVRLAEETGNVLGLAGLVFGLTDLAVACGDRKAE